MSMPNYRIGSVEFVSENNKSEKMQIRVIGANLWDSFAFLFIDFFFHVPMSIWHP